MPTTAQALVDLLARRGIEYLIGMPGGGSVIVFDQLRGEDRIRPILVRHEHTAAIMADAYARASGKTAAVLGQGAFVGSNGAFGIMEALTSSSPMLVIGDTSDFGAGSRPTTQAVTGEYGTPDLLGLMRSITKMTGFAATPDEVLISADQALHHARAGCPGPAGLVFRSNSIMAEFDPAAAPVNYGLEASEIVTPTARPELVDELAAALRAARLPVILAGKGVHNALAHDELAALAELAGAPVVTTYKGKSAIPETHPLAAGMVGTYGRPASNALLQEADVVLVLGAKLSTGSTAGGMLLDPHRQRLYQVDVEARNLGWAMPVHRGVLGDAKNVLGALVDRFKNFEPAAETVADRTAHVAELLAADAVAADPDQFRDTSPVLPQRLVSGLQAALPADANICLDAGNNRVWTGLFLKTVKPHSWFAPGGLAGMGWALPGAMGVKLARPDQPSIAIAGDGGFMMSVHALATSIEAELPVVTVVFNDSGLGMVRHHQAEPVASLFQPTDYAEIAIGFGADGFRVEDGRDVTEAIQTALHTGRTTVVDVVLDETVAPDAYRAKPRKATET